MLCVASLLLKNTAIVRVIDYVHSLTEHYPEQKLVGLRGVQKAHQFLTTPMMGGKRMIDMGQDKKNLDNIKVHFAA